MDSLGPKVPPHTTIPHTSNCTDDIVVRYTIHYRHLQVEHEHHLLLFDYKYYDGIYLPSSLFFSPNNPTMINTQPEQVATPILSFSHKTVTYFTIAPSCLRLLQPVSWLLNEDDSAFDKHIRVQIYALFAIRKTLYAIYCVFWVVFYAHNIQRSAATHASTHHKTG